MEGLGGVDEARKPACCEVVPVLYQGPFHTVQIEIALDNLRHSGSRAVPGYMKPEGLVVFHEASRTLFKKTCEHDEQWKGSTGA